MSHFTVLVIGENPKEQLKPFQENNMGDYPEDFLEFYEIDWKSDYNTKEEAFSDGYKEHEGKIGYWENPNAKWDWYVLGGRWSGYYKLKPGAEGLLGKPGGFQNTPEEGYVDQCKRKDIDIEYMREEARKKAIYDFKFASSVINGGSFTNWPEVKERFKNDIKKARIFYNNQNVVEQWRIEPKVRERLGIFSKPDDFNMTEEEYVQKQVNSAGVTFAVIKDGKWYERGETGWWGVVSDEKDNWEEEFQKLFDEIPEETLVSVYDCHI